MWYSFQVKKWLKRYFIPHSENAYKPHILQRTAVLCMSLLVLLTFLSANVQALLWQTSDWLISTILPAVVVDLTNENRAEAAVNSLVRSPVLDQAATLKAQHMAQNSYFAHYAPDGTSPWYWFDQVSYDYIHAGENLAVHFSDSSQVVRAWMDSPTHRDNIVSGKYTEIGVGTARGTYQGFDTIFVVQLFGHPTSPTVPVAQEIPAPAPIPSGVASEPLAVAEITPSVDQVDQVVIEASAPVIESDVAILDLGSSDSLEPTSTFELAVEAPADTQLALNTENELMTATDAAPEVVLVSDLISTSAVAGIESVEPHNIAGTSEEVLTIARLATQPQAVLQYVYLVTAAFVVIALTLSIVIEIRKQHPVQIAYGAALLVLMALLSYVHFSVTDGALIAQAAIWTG